jgi:hypothetical protein
MGTDMCTEAQWFFVIPAAAFYLCMLYWMSALYVLGSNSISDAVLQRSDELRSSKYFFWAFLAGAVSLIGFGLAVFLPCGLETALGFYKFGFGSLGWWGLAIISGLYGEFRGMMSALGDRVGRKDSFAALTPYLVITLLLLLWWVL